MTNCTIIGIADNHNQWFAPETAQVIAEGKVFSGGKRHHEIMQRWLPDNCVWIDITVPLVNVFAHYQHYENVVVFASGDPLFYGFAATVQRECPKCKVRVLPTFNSLQMLAHRMVLPYQDMKMVSQTGRPWQPLDESLINGERLIGVLTDRHKTPQAIATRMEEYGYGDYEITVGECLGNEKNERITTYATATELAHEQQSFAQPNCMIMRRTTGKRHQLGIPEQAFHLLNGRAKMITKMPVRLVSLSMLDLANKNSMWDIGFCTGSVSIEARLQYPHLNITSFEVREEGRELILANAQKFGAPGIEAIIGDFLTLDISNYPHPDAVFIGGHGGKLKEMIVKIKEVMLPNGCIVFNSVSDESRQMFETGIAKVGMQITTSTTITVDDHNPIHILKAE